MSDSHDIPPHLMPEGDNAISADEEEIELNEQLEDTYHWAYTEEPEDGKCPYCGNYYKQAVWASNFSVMGEIDPVDKVEHNYIHYFDHTNPPSLPAKAKQANPIKCSPHQEENPSDWGLSL